MLKSGLEGKNIILASGSPRRKFFLEELGLDFEIRLKPIEEHFPSELKGHEISDYLAVSKAQPFLNELRPNDVLITADTIVWLNDEALNKPSDIEDAKCMLEKLSGTEHEVISSVAITTTRKQEVVTESTRVKFKELNPEEIDFYVENYKPFDKAGSYGILEWIGYIGIERIDGSYFNVMGFPVQKFYERIRNL
ncbi:MAG: Maf family nucleotide pyrophosphatase [Lutimonas sp.]